MASEKAEKFVEDFLKNFGMDLEATLYRMKRMSTKALSGDEEVEALVFARDFVNSLVAKGVTTAATYKLMRHPVVEEFMDHIEPSLDKMRDDEEFEKKCREAAKKNG